MSDDLENIVSKCLNKLASIAALKDSMKEYSMDKCEGFDLMGCYSCSGYNSLCTGYVPLFKPSEE